jgi:ATP-dependent RNA helicase DeaD
LPLVSQLVEDYDPQAIAAAALQLAYTQLQSDKSEQAALQVLAKQPHNPEGGRGRDRDRDGGGYNSGRPIKRGQGGNGSRSGRDGGGRDGGGYDSRRSSSAGRDRAPIPAPVKY